VTKPLKKNQKAKELILDAAENLFAYRGFKGTTTREITREAGVPLGLMSYYFGTKEDLYREVIERRSVEHAAAIRASLQSAAEQANGNPTAEMLIRAYFSPLVERSLRGGEGWKSYIHLLSRAANTPRNEPYVESFDKTYVPVVREFIEILKGCHPDADEEAVYWSYYFLSSSIIHILLESGSIDSMSGGKFRSTDLETILDKMATFFAAGMQRLAAA